MPCLFQGEALPTASGLSNQFPVKRFSRTEKKEYSNKPNRGTFDTVFFSFFIPASRSVGIFFLNHFSSLSLSLSLSRTNRRPGP